MPKRVITKISEEQEVMLPSYREKWRSFAISTESIDEEKVESVIKAAYLVSDFSEPEILFYKSPFAAIQGIFAIDDVKGYLGKDIHIKFIKRVVEHLLHQTEKQIDKNVYRKLRNKIHFPEFPHYPTEDNQIISYFLYEYSISSCIDSQLIDDFDKCEEEQAYFFQSLKSNLTRTAGWAISGCVLDFCISVLNVGHDKNKWQVLQDLIHYCGFIFQFENVCISCNRPCELSFDNNNLLHGEGEPAIKFSDAYSVYARHGEYIFSSFLFILSLFFGKLLNTVFNYC
ncbi:MAG: hypothetical protein SWZ49_33690 [Cyanobacteriota bacterium]|nr:hypothetical protein [Cyanobacteriota bacterium]